MTRHAFLALGLKGAPRRFGSSHGLGRLTDETPDADLQAMEQRLSRLRAEHRELDAAINALMASGNHDQIQIQRLKKRKLQLKDQIRVLEDGQLPNIIA